MFVFHRLKIKTLILISYSIDKNFYEVFYNQYLLFLFVSLITSLTEKKETLLFTLCMQPSLGIFPTLFLHQRHKILHSQTLPSINNSTNHTQIRHDNPKLRVLRHDNPKLRVQSANNGVTRQNIIKSLFFRTFCVEFYTPGTPKFGS